MRLIITFVTILLLLVVPVSAMDLTAPTAPESAEDFMPAETESFSDGLLIIIKEAIGSLYPQITEAAKLCLALVAVTLLLSLLKNAASGTAQATSVVGAIVISTLLLKPANTMIHLGIATVRQISEYGKLLIPVITAALAAQGGVTTSAALNTGTVFFNTLLTTLITKLIMPLIYIHICIGIVNSVVFEPLLTKVHKFLKWLMTWGLKITIYLFTGYLGITGVISGTADAAAVKATKLTISGVVPVVGGIISDASETIIVSAGIMKNSIGIYGLLATIAIWIGPFIQIGIQYIFIRVTGAICSIWSGKQVSAIIDEFGSAMGYVLAATATICILLLVSVICFMRGMS